MLTDLYHVWKIYPTAVSELRVTDDATQTDEWVILSVNDPDAVVLGRGNTLREAWADAARNVRAANS